jgi:hypothetical protein
MHTRYPSMGEVFFALCKSVDTPVSLGAWLRFEHNQLALAEMEISPGDYHDAESFAVDYLVVSFLSKYKGLKTGLNLEDEALRKFETSETQCKETNIRLRKARSGATLCDAFTAGILFDAKRKISALLGRCSLFAIEPWFGWGPGATYEIPRRRSFVDTKVCELPFAVTRDSRGLFDSVVRSDRHWSDAVGASQPLTTEVNVCRQAAVPKSAKTHRLIAVEPRANSFLQKGVGGFIRSRLKRVGVNLDDQKRNQDGAKRAYTDRLATLDLKAASDTVAIELVYELLPLDWALLLDDLRSKYIETMSGEKVRLEKFSSMGNGFTFELESLIFWAITRSVVDALQGGGEVLVYGDDIICPQSCAPRVIDVLAFIGFTVNDQKSFTEGNFYESCGKHFFQGKEVTPIYQKETIVTSTGSSDSDGTLKESPVEIELLRLGNRLIRYAYRYGSEDRLLQWISSPWRRCWRGAASTKFFQIPLGTEGDDGWVLPADEFATRKQDRNFGISCKVMVFPQKRFPAHERALLAWTLRRGVKTEQPFGGEVTSSPDTTMSVPTAGTRWVMPSWEFAISF